jgi:hypothetical protein
MGNERHFRQSDLDELAEAMVDLKDFLFKEWAGPTIGNAPQEIVEKTIETLEKYAVSDSQVAIYHDQLVESYERNYPDPKNFNLIN